MTHKILTIATFATLLVANFSSCKKDETDVEKPTIVVAEPLTNDTLSLSADPKVHIEFTATDNDGLHEVVVNVTNGSTNFYTNTKDVDNTTLNFHEHFIPTGITAVTPMTLTIDADDHTGNTISKSVIFYVKP